MREAISVALGFVCYHVWIRLPLDWHDTRAAKWMLSRTGDWVYRDLVPISPEVFEFAAELRERAAANKARQEATDG